MSKTDQLSEQHIQQYESRLKHIEELMARVREKGATAELNPEIAEAEQHRQELADHVEKLRKNPEQAEIEEIEHAGPMGVWDVIAQKLEHLVERLEK